MRTEALLVIGLVGVIATGIGLGFDCGPAEETELPETTHSPYALPGEPQAPRQRHAVGSVPAAEPSDDAPPRVGFGTPVDPGRASQHRGRLEQTLVSVTTKLARAPLPATRSDAVAHFRDLHSLELTRAKLDVLRRGQARFCEQLPVAPDGYLVPASIRADGFVVYPIAKAAHPTLRNLEDELRHLRRLEVTEAAARFNALGFSERQRRFEEDRRLRNAILACKIETSAGAERKLALEQEWMRSGIPAGLIVTRNGYLARPRR